MSDIEKAFTSYDIQACLYDEQRVEYFRKAIFATVKEGDVVVDGGSGTGLLGMFAAQAGAARVYCVEINREYITVIEENARRNKLADRIVAIHADASTVDLPGPVDVIVSEVISAGFFYEPQLQIIANLKKFLKPGGVVIPVFMDNTVELIDAQEELYGLNFSYDARYRRLPGDRSLTEPAVYLETSFLHDDTPEFISRTVQVRSVESGTANAVRIAYRIQFSGDLWADQPTEFLLNPQIIFLPERVPLRRDASYEVSLDYQASSSPLTCEVIIKPR